MVLSCRVFRAFQDRTFPQPEGSPPPTQLELPIAGEAEFVICDYTIEVLFRDLKQHLGLGACIVRHPEAGERHLALCLLSYVGLELLRLECHQVTGRELSSITIGEVKADLAGTMVLVTPPEDLPQVATVRVEAWPKNLFSVAQAAFAKPVETRRVA